jgi:teichuronic acid biosynthesis glycosyltransferase TuaH
MIAQNLTAMYKNHDIIILALSRWDNVYSSTSYSLAKEFSKNNRVFYIDHPFTWKDYFSSASSAHVQIRKEALLYGKNIYKKVEGLSENFTTVTSRLTFPINWLKPGEVYEKFSGINDRILYNAIRHIIKDYNIGEYIFINSFDPYHARSFPADIKPALKIYQTVDDISQEPYIARHGVRLEREAISKADITLATSKELTTLKSRFSDRVFYLPNAADISLFKKAVSQKYSKPKELRNIDKKIIGYTGNIGLRIDYELLKKVALAHSDKLLLMVGPLGNDSYKKHGLDKIPNILFTGPKDISELPAYLQYIDCAIIPFEYSTLTKSIYPLKINEYLAAGKAVVSTAFSADISEFRDVAYIADTEDQFLSMIESAVDDNSAYEISIRMEKAETNTWAARVARFWEIVDTVASKDALPKAMLEEQL